MRNTIEVRAARTQAQVLAHQCDEVLSFDTIAEAKRFARRCLTPAYAELIEASEPMGYAQVIVNGECHADYFSKTELARLTKESTQDA